ncbi:TPA: hypothetical protein ACN983_005282 [Vibrio parahaemolyticus]|nr:hypothetical protein [Vibrio parahaemolyticus]
MNNIYYRQDAFFAPLTPKTIEYLSSIKLGPIQIDQIKRELKDIQKLEEKALHENNLRELRKSQLLQVLQGQVKH